MSQWHHWPEDIRGKQEAYRSSVWTFAQRPTPYLLVLVLGTWVDSWAIFHMLNGILGPYSHTKGFGDFTAAVFVTYFPGIFVSAFVVFGVFLVVAAPVRLLTGRDLIFGSAQNSLAVEDDTGAMFCLALPLVVGNVLGFIFWMYDLNPLGFLPW